VRGLWGSAALAALLVVVLAPRTASANVSTDVELGVPINSRASTGWGAGVRFGKEFHLPLLALTPEAGLWYYGFGGNFGSQVIEAKGGLRVAFGELIRPGAFAHVGPAYNIPDVGDNRVGLTFDGGLFLDFTLIPLVTLGVHGSYNYLSVGDRSGASSQWATVGAHAEFVF